MPGLQNLGVWVGVAFEPLLSLGLEFGADLMRNGGIPGLYGVLL